MHTSMQRTDMLLETSNSSLCANQATCVAGEQFPFPQWELLWGTSAFTEH